MPKTKKKNKIVAETKTALFSLSVDFGDLIYKSQGDTIVEALSNLTIDKFEIKGYGMFTLKSEGKIFEYKATPFEIRRFLINKTAKELFAKKLLMSLK